MGWNGGARRGGGSDGGKVDGGADRTTRELEGPKETTRVGAEKMAEGERAGKVEKGRTRYGRDERRSRERAKGIRSTGGS